MTNGKMHSLGRKIKELRKEKNLTQSDLAKLIGCAQNTIAEWENENKEPNSRFITALANVLGISIDNLLHPSENKNSGIPCYGEIKENNFLLQKRKLYSIRIPQSEYKNKRYSFKILGSFLEPLAHEHDYCIFEKKQVEDNDIVLVTDQRSKLSSIKIWRQDENSAVISDVSLETNAPSVFLDIENNTYKIKNTDNQVIVEGVLVVVKRPMKIIKSFPKIKYVLG